MNPDLTRRGVDRATLAGEGSCARQCADQTESESVLRFLGEVVT